MTMTEGLSGEDNTETGKFRSALRQVPAFARSSGPAALATAIVTFVVVTALVAAAAYLADTHATSFDPLKMDIRSRLPVRFRRDCDERNWKSRLLSGSRPSISGKRPGCQGYAPV